MAKGPLAGSRKVEPGGMPLLKGLAHSPLEPDFRLQAYISPGELLAVGGLRAHQFLAIVEVIGVGSRSRISAR